MSNADLHVLFKASELLYRILDEAVNNHDGHVGPALEDVFTLVQEIAYSKYEWGDTSIEFDRSYNKFHEAVKKDNIARLFK